MECNGIKWNIYKIYHTNSFEVILNWPKKKTRVDTEQKVHNCVNILTIIKIICLQNIETWKIESLNYSFQSLFLNQSFHN